MILVTGGTGNVGANVVRELLDAGEKVRVLSREPGDRSFPDGVEAVPGNLNRPESLPAALSGVERAFRPRTGGTAKTPTPASQPGGGIGELRLGGEALRTRRQRQLLQVHLDLRARREQDAVRTGGHPPVTGPPRALAPVAGDRPCTPAGLPVRARLGGTSHNIIPQQEPHPLPTQRRPLADLALGRI